MCEPKLLHLVDAAKLVRVPVAWLKAEAKAGRVPGLRVGRTWVFNAQALIDCLADRAAKKNPAQPETPSV